VHFELQRCDTYFDSIPQSSWVNIYLVPDNQQRRPRRTRVGQVSTPGYTCNADDMDELWEEVDRIGKVVQKGSIKLDLDNTTIGNGNLGPTPFEYR